ncbi:MAG: adenylosuccinate synthase [Myxococcales bacterium]|nr:adenylosuccinate synthase [Myxococcota bacterium]MDW8281996.1 adenylosuccinate synthase [Myxococcales bacterium]
MANVVIVGAQWGDEGKGKVVDLYSEFADVVVRFGGGANAGHTLVVDGKKLITHLIPSGVLHGRGKRCVLGDGMVIDPATLLQELRALQAESLLCDERDLVIGDSAHVILPHHKEIDRLREERAGALGTTRRGIGPCYEAKMARRGVRMRDLLYPERLHERIARQVEDCAPLLRQLGGTVPDVDAVTQEYVEYGQALAPYIQDASRVLHEEMKRGQHVLFEGAQGALLDIDHGTYPFVTSSTTLAGGACASCGIGPTTISSVIGIAKAYTTRVGAGPFPTELTGEAAARLREAGAEYGATTGRPRRCGWLDVAALRLAVRWNGLSGLALTKLDVLSFLRRIKICVGYRLEPAPGGSGVADVRDELPLDPDELQRAVPVYEELDGWDVDLRDVRDVDDLPPGARRYVGRIEALLGIDCHLISIGPARAETIVIKNPFR